jgi:hypothetical protein
MLALMITVMTPVDVVMNGLFVMIILNVPKILVIAKLVVNLLKFLAMTKMNALLTLVVMLPVVFMRLSSVTIITLVPLIPAKEVANMKK